MTTSVTTGVAREECTPLNHRWGVVYVVMQGNARLGTYECVCEGLTYARFWPYDETDGHLDSEGYLRVFHSDELDSYAVRMPLRMGGGLVPVKLFATDLKSKHADF